MDTSGTSSVGVGPGSQTQELSVEELMAELPPRQRIAIDSLIVGHTVQGSAEKAGVHRGTLSRWILKDAHFIAALNALELEVIRTGTLRLMNLVPTALMAIENAINSGNVNAAIQLVKHAILSRRTTGPITPKAVAREIEVAELQRQATMQQQQAVFEEQTEEATVRIKDIQQRRDWRIYNEHEKELRDAERAERERAKAEAARQDAQAKLPPQKNTQSERQPQRIEAPPKLQSEGANSVAQAPKHPGQPTARPCDDRVAAAAKAAVGIEQVSR